MATEAPERPASGIDTLGALFNLSEAMTRRLERRLFSALKISAPQARILLFLDEAAPAPIKPTHIAALLVQQTHSVSGLLNRLEDAGLIERVRDRNDRRVVWVSLTPAGKRAAAVAGHAYWQTCGDLEAIIESISTDVFDVAAGFRSFADRAIEDVDVNAEHRAAALALLGRGAASP